MSSVQFCTPASQLSVITYCRPRLPISAADGVLVLSEVVVEIGLHVAAVELVHLEAGGFGRGRGVARAGERIAHAQHHPASGRRRPVERAVGLHPGRQVEDVGLADGILGRRRRSGKRVEVGRGGESGLLLEAVHARARVQDQLGDLVIRRGAAAAAAAGAPAAARRAKVTRKKRAVTGGKAMVCWAAPPAGIVATVRNCWPSSLASRAWRWRRRRGHPGRLR